MNWFLEVDVAVRGTAHVTGIESCSAMKVLRPAGSVSLFPGLHGILFVEGCIRDGRCLRQKYLMRIRIRLWPVWYNIRQVH